MRITQISSAGLRHGTPQGGWANEIRPEDCVHTLIAVFTDEGITGWGSAFTNDELVRGALNLCLTLFVMVSVGVLLLMAASRWVAVLGGMVPTRPGPQARTTPPRP